MAIDLTGLSARELQALIAKANQRKKTLAKRKPIAAVRSRLVSLAKAEGYTVDELFGTARMVGERAGVSAKKAGSKTSTPCWAVSTAGAVWTGPVGAGAWAALSGVGDGFGGVCAIAGAARTDTAAVASQMVFVMVPLPVARTVPAVRGGLQLQAGQVD